MFQKERNFKRIRKNKSDQSRKIGTTIRENRKDWTKGEQTDRNTNGKEEWEDCQFEELLQMLIGKFSWEKDNSFFERPHKQSLSAL